MTEDKKISDTVDRIVGLGQEVDARGVAAVNEQSLALAREILRRRVTVIDATGRPSIASADLAYRMGVAGITQSG